MKYIITLAVIAVVVAVSAAQPTFEENEEYGQYIQQQIEEAAREPEPSAGLRFRRVTCDLLSMDTPIGSINHAACAAHCLSMGRGFRGGRCIDGVCHCRK